MTGWDTEAGNPRADLETAIANLEASIPAPYLSTVDELAAARVNLAAYDQMAEADPLVLALTAWWAEGRRRGADLRRRRVFTAPTPLPIDGHEYRRRRRHR